MGSHAVWATSICLELQREYDLIMECGEFNFYEGEWCVVTRPLDTTSNDTSLCVPAHHCLSFHDSNI
jgi:hypothetical protein